MVEGRRQSFAEPSVRDHLAHRPGRRRWPRVPRRERVEEGAVELVGAARARLLEHGFLDALGEALLEPPLAEREA